MIHEEITDRNNVKEWLQNLKEGDKVVVVCVDSVERRNRIEKVMKTSNEYVWVAYHRYSRCKDGQGPTYRDEHYHIEELTPEWQDKFDKTVAKFRNCLRDREFN